MSQRDLRDVPKGAVEAAPLNVPELCRTCAEAVTLSEEGGMVGLSSTAAPCWRANEDRGSRWSLRVQHDLL